MRKLLVLLLLAPCALLAQVPDYVPTDGLVAYWPLDGNGLDQSGSGHHLTETNIQSGSDRYGAAESAVAFNGEDSHLTLAAFDLNQTGSFSVGFWAQMNPSAFTEPQCLFYEGIDGEFHFANADPGVVFTQFHWAAKANSSAWYGPAAGPLSSGEWNHFVGTYDQGLLELFLNGVSAGTQQAACCSQAPTDQLVLGARRVTSFVEHPFSGALDEFALWNRVLTADEIQTLFLAENTPAIPDYVPTDGLVAYWPLDGDATNAHGADYDGNIAGATPTNDRHGEESSAFAFDGVDDQIIIPNDFNFAVLTVSAWFYRSSQADTYQAIVDRSLTNNIGWWIEESQVANEHLFFTGGVASGNYFTTTASLPDFGEWTHVCATYEAGHQELYLNGVLTATDDNALPLPFPDVNLYIGSRTSTAWFHGAIDDVGIWDRALTTEEIGELYSESTEAEPSTENLALEFSGISDYLGPNAGILEIPFADALDRTGSDPFTIASDVLFDADGFPYALFHTGQDGDPENSIRFNISTSELEFMWENTGTNYKLECALPATTVGILDTGVWHNIAASWDGVTLTLFVNGIEVASEAPGNGGPGETEDRPFYWGSHLGGNELDGQLDNTQFWTIGLTQEDIQSHLNCPPTGNEPGLEAYWTFNGPDSDLTLDITGNGHHGTAQGVQKVPSTRPACSEGNDDEGSIELLIVGATGEETATREALEAYQLDSTLTDRDLSITEVDFQDSISPCGQWDALLASKDAVLFLGTANLDNCSWEDIIPALDSFMRAGGEVYLQAENSYSMVTRFDGNGSTWPEYWHDHMTEAEAANWFGTAFTAQQLWCCGMASTNAHCSDNASVLGISHDCNPLFAGIYDYPFGNECTGWLGEPWLYEVPSEETSDGIGFSVFQFGGDPADPENPNNALAGAEAVFGRTFDSGHLIVLGDNHPGFGYEGSRNLLGNLIHGLSHPEGLSDLIAPTTDCTAPAAILGCTDAAACNYDPTATEDDGSCQLPPTIGWNADTSICAMPFVLDAGAGFDAYLWNTGDTTQAITTFQEGLYSVEVTDTGTRDDYSLQFDGQDDYVDVPDIDLTGVTHFTFCASARLVNETGTDFYNILSSGENGPEQLQWGINDNDLRMAFYHADINPVESNVAIERFEWYHTAVVYDGTDLILYLNAEEVQRQSVTLNLTQSVRFIGQWLIDSDNLGVREPWHGQLDHVGIWNTALSQNQIAQRMSCPNSPELDGLMALWNFEADAGNVVSGNGDVVSIGTVIGANYAALVPDNLCPGCSATDSIHVTVDFNCIYCGEGTEWDEESQQCIAVDSGPTPSCGEGTVWDPVAQECIVAIPTDTDFDGCVTAGDVLNLLATFGTCPPVPEWPDTPPDTTGTNWMCGDPLPYQGYDYATVQIGDQCWFAENLQSEAYQNGDPIPGELNGTEWQTAQGAQSIYEGLSLSEVLTGRLYNLHTIVDPRNLCPAGWHIPSFAEFNALLDPAEVTELKSTSGWTGEENSGSSGFNALPGGRRDFWGNWYDAGTLGVWWTSTPEADGHASWRLEAGQSSASSQPNTLQNGFSVRCVKD